MTLTPVSDPTTEIDALADSGFDLIVVQQDLINEVYDTAVAHPDTHFVAFDNFDADMGLPNVTVAYPADVPAGTYLAGAAAALASTTGTIGYLGGHPSVNDPFRAGFEAGARAIDPEIDILSTYLVQSGSFDVFTQPEEGAALADDLYRAGADVVFHAAGDSGDLIPQVADDLSDELGRHLWVIGVDTDQWLQVNAKQREHVLTSLLKRHDRELEIALDRYFAGELEAGTSPVGMTDGIYALSTSGGHLTTEWTARLDRLADELTRGEKTVSDVPMAAPTMLPAADQTIRVEMRGDECVVEQTATDHRGHAPGRVPELDRRGGTSSSHRRGFFVGRNSRRCMVLIRSVRRRWGRQRRRDPRQRPESVDGPVRWLRVRSSRSLASHRRPEWLRHRTELAGVMRSNLGEPR